MDRRTLMLQAAALAALAALPAGKALAASPKFPDRFLWGASTAGHQIEGNNVASDFWLMENVEPRGFAEPSGDAVNSFALWPRDLDLVKALGLNTYRFSLEWSRIEPERGLVSIAMLDHYKAMIEGCRARGLTPIVTFNHFSCPRWFTAAGGWTHADSPALFAAFCDRAMRHLGDQIGYAVTLNEPNLPALLLWTPIPAKAYDQKAANRAAAAKAVGAASFPGGFMFRADEFAPMVANLVAAHRQGKAAIKAVRGDLPVGMSLSVADDQAAGPSSKRDVKRAAAYGVWLEAARDDDFVGVQNYVRTQIDANGTLPPPHDAPQSDMHTEIYPASLGGSVRYVHEATKRPVLVTEHGLSTQDDRLRAAFIPLALASLKQAIDDGVPVLGYVHWSLLDNFEWYQGYAQKFGLVAVDRKTFARTPKPSAHVLGAIARANAVAG
ncbi:family 1 glycosylhydrolase [Caulobacter hibisci]|uniref:family 1 glycosylhydrolase n=1 Tax=Caulobacter hibisci TaxID=2035993 RepID=UPI002FCDBF48